MLGIGLPTILRNGSVDLDTGMAQRRKRPRDPNHLVGAGQHGRRHLEAKRPRSLEVDHQLVRRGRLHRQVGRFLALEDAVDAGRLCSQRV